MNRTMRIACTVFVSTTLIVLVQDRSANAQTATFTTSPAANATAGASGVTGFAGTQTGAVSPSSFGTAAGVSTNQGAAAGGTFNQLGPGFGVNQFNPATAGAASVTPFAPVTTPVTTPTQPVTVTAPNGATVTVNPVTGTVVPPTTTITGTTANGASVSATTSGVPNLVTTPYYIYVPYPMGGGPSSGGGFVPQPGGSASESVVAPQAPPQPDYRAVPGGRANFDLDDPYFRSAVTR